MQNMMGYLSEFKKVIEYCIINTEFKKELKIYQRDLVFINKLIKDLLEKKNPAAIREIILDPQTSKIFTDYWRHGKCGDLHNAAFLKLVKEIRVGDSVSNE
jgi:hypothetical protein